MSSMHTPPESRSSVERDRQVIVTDGGRRETGAGAIIAVVLGLLAVLFIGWLLFSGGDAVDESPFPDTVNVDVEDGEAPPADSGDTTVNNFEQPPAQDQPADQPPADQGGSTTGGSTTG